MSDLEDELKAKQRRRRWVKNAFETLVERAQYKPEDVRFIQQMLNKDVAGRWAGAIDAATITSQNAGEAVYRAIDVALSQALKEQPSLEVVAALYNELPRDTVALRLTVTEVMRQTVSAAEERGRDELYPDVHLDSLNNYTARLMQQRELKLAEQTARKAVDFGRRHTDREPDKLAPGLAQAYGNLGTALSILGRDQEADEPTCEATERYRVLYTQSADRYARDLAISLNNRVGLLDRLGDLDGAQGASAEAVQLFRDKRQDQDEALSARNLESWVRDVRPDLATALIARATILGKLGRHDEELKTAKEAVEILQPLADQFPDQFLYLLGQALNNFAGALDRLKRHGEAEAVIAAAVDIFERLTNLQPATFRHLLAHVLNGRVVALVQLDRLSEAEVVCRRTVDEYKLLCAENNDLFRDGLERARRNLDIIVHELRTRAGGAKGPDQST